MNRVSQLWRRHGYNALNYQHEQFENTARGHRAAAAEQVQEATARVAAETAPQMAVRLEKTLQIKVETDFKDRQRMLVDFSSAWLAAITVGLGELMENDLRTHGDTVMGRLEVHA